MNELKDYDLVDNEKLNEQFQKFDKKLIKKMKKNEKPLIKPHKIFLNYKK